MRCEVLDRKAVQDLSIRALPPALDGAGGRALSEATDPITRARSKRHEVRSGLLGAARPLISRAEHRVRRRSGVGCRGRPGWCARSGGLPLWAGCRVVGL